MTSGLLMRSVRLGAPLLALGLVVACGGKRPPVLATSPGADGAAADATASVPPAAPLDEGPDVQPLAGEGPAGSDLGAGTFAEEGGPLADVRFDLDSAALSDQARVTLDQHANWLRAQPTVRATIEGHCDERGTVDYNLALGEQRARAARDYLVSLGIAAERLRVVSYGKERPLDPAASEEAYARNRRAHFALSR